MKKIKNYKNFIWWAIVWFLIVTAWVSATTNWTLWDLFKYELSSQDTWADWVYVLDWKNILDGSVDETEIELNSLTQDNLANDSVWSGEIIDWSVWTSEVLNDSLTSSDLAANSIWNSELVNNVNFNIRWLTANWDWLRVKWQNWLYFEDYGWWFHMTDTTWIRSFWNKHVYINKMLRADDWFQVDWKQVIWSDAWVEWDRIRQNSIDSWEIQDNSLTTNDILNNTITENDISDSFKARDSDKLDWLDSTSFLRAWSSWDQIQDGTIDSSEIQDNSLTASDLAENSVWNSELVNNVDFNIRWLTADWNWLRVKWQNGLYFQNYGWWFHMTDTTRIKSYWNKNLYVNKTIRADGWFEVDWKQVIWADAWVEWDRIRQNSIDSSEIQDWTIEESDLSSAVKNKLNNSITYYDSRDLSSNISWWTELQTLWTRDFCALTRSDFNNSVTWNQACSVLKYQGIWVLRAFNHVTCRASCFSF